jgi:hypothetical protein
MNQDFEIEDGRLIKYHGAGGHVIIPDGVTCIASCAFWGCKSLLAVTFPDSVTEVQDSAFYACKNLKKIIRYGIEISSDYAVQDNLEYAEYLKAFLENPDDQEISQRMRKYLPFLFYIDTEHFKICLETGKFFDQKNISFFIRYLNHKQLYEKQILLMNYKHQHFNSDETGENLKL